MVLEEGSIRAARGGSSRDIRRIKKPSAARDAGFAVYSPFLPCTTNHQAVAIMHFHRLIGGGGGAPVRLCGGANSAPLARHGAPALLSARGGGRRLGRWRLKKQYKQIFLNKTNKSHLRPTSHKPPPPPAAAPPPTRFAAAAAAGEGAWPRCAWCGSGRCGAWWWRVVLLLRAAGFRAR